MKERQIKVSLEPHPWDNIEEPYFWVVLEWEEKIESWCNSGLCGWAKTPTDAFNEGLAQHTSDIVE